MWQLDLLIYSWVSVQSIIYIGFSHYKKGINEVSVGVHNIWVKNAFTVSIVNAILLFANTWSVIQNTHWKDSLALLANNCFLLTIFSVCLLKRIRHMFAYVVQLLLSVAGIVYICVYQIPENMSVIIPALMSLTVGVLGVLLMDLTMDIRFLYTSSLQSLLQMFEYYTLILQTHVNYPIVLLLMAQPILSIYCWYMKIISNRDGEGVMLLSFGGVFVCSVLVCSIVNLLILSASASGSDSDENTISVNTDDIVCVNVSIVHSAKNRQQNHKLLLIPGQTDPFPSDMNGLFQYRVLSCIHLCMMTALVCTLSTLLEHT